MISKTQSPVVLGLLGSLALTAPAFSQARSQTQDELKALKVVKLEAPFLKKFKWFTDFDQARAEAKKTNKVIFAYFGRSYAP